MLQRLDFNHMHIDGVHTGGMAKDKFLGLKNDIDENGLTNPIVVEVDSGNPPRFRIAMGNNRVEAVQQLGEETIKALVLFRSNTPPAHLPTPLPIQDFNLEGFMSEHHPGDETWKKSGWAARLLKFVTARKEQSNE